MFCSVSAHIWWRVVVGDQFQHNIVTIRDFQFLASFGWFFYRANATKTPNLPESGKIEPRGPVNWFPECTTLLLRAPGTSWQDWIPVTHRSSWFSSILVPKSSEITSEIDNFGSNFGKFRNFGVGAVFRFVMSPPLS